MPHYELLNDICIKHIGIKSPYSAAKIKGIQLVTSANIVAQTGNQKKLIPIIEGFMEETGQRAKVLKAQESVAAFKIRKNMECGIKVELRGSAYQNYVKSLRLALPSLSPLKYGTPLGSGIPSSVRPGGAYIQFLGKGVGLNLFASRFV
jgi:ribosomal protein L5